MKLGHSTTKGILGTVFLLCTRIVRGTFSQHCLEEIPTQCIHWEQYWLVSTKLCHFSVGISNLRNIQCIYKLVVVQV